MLDKIKIFLKNEINKRVRELDSAGCGEGRMSSSCEHGNEPSNFMEAENFLP
jgi:hypothetical protein